MEKNINIFINVNKTLIFVLVAQKKLWASSSQIKKKKKEKKEGGSFNSYIQEVLKFFFLERKFFLINKGIRILQRQHNVELT